MPKPELKPMKFLFVLLLVIPLSLFCQKGDSTKTIKLSIGLTFSPDYCYRTMVSDPDFQLFADFLNEYEIPKVGFTSGLNLCFKPVKRFSFETGLLYSDKGEKTIEYSLYYQAPTTQADPALPKTSRYVYHYIYLDIPFKANFFILTKRAKLSVGAGISTNLYLSNYITNIHTYSDGHESRESSKNLFYTFPPLNIAAIAGVGFSYDITKKLYIKFEPTGRYSITPTSSTPIRKNMYSVGLNTGIYLKL